MSVKGATAGDPWHLTFLMGRWCMKSSTACLLASILHWPLGLFLSEQTLAIRVFGAIPATGNTPVTLHGYTAVLLQEPPGGPIGLLHSCPPPGTSRRSYWTATQLSSSRNLQEVLLDWYTAVLLQEVLWDWYTAVLLQEVLWDWYTADLLREVL